MRHLNPDKAVDDMLRDFFCGRLPPFEKGVKKGKKKSAPSDESKIKLLHPDHVRVLIGDLSEGIAETDGSDEEMSEAEEEAEEENSEEEASEESEKENEKDSKKGGKKQKAKKTGKAKETKTKRKRAKSEEDDEAEEDDEKEEEADDDDEGSGDENEGFENEGGGDEYILVLHSVKNNRVSHMMGDKDPCSILKFPFRYKDALRQITSEHDKYIAVNSLQLAEKDRLSLVKSLWDEGLLDME